MLPLQRNMLEESVCYDIMSKLCTKCFKFPLKYMYTNSYLCVLENTFCIKLCMNTSIDEIKC